MASGRVGWKLVKRIWSRRILINGRGCAGGCWYTLMPRNVLFLGLLGICVQVSFPFVRVLVGRGIRLLGV
jgi:hypothetical protein